MSGERLVSMERINNYLDEILYHQLRSIKMPYRFVKQIQDDIRTRMLSCLAYWNAIDVRKTILFPSCEEALFYEPRVPDENIREFVVTTIRNSKLEIAASVDCFLFKIQEPISDTKIREITSEAIRYFEKYDLSVLAKEIKEIKTVDNVYKIARDKYPLAWNILYRLANLETERLDIEEKHVVDLKENFWENSMSGMPTTVCNGFTLEFDENLKEALGEVISGTAKFFYSDCFKQVSRNFEKILHILQIILEHNAVFCTCNYYISLDCIERRKKVLQAAHNSKDVINNINANGAPDKIKECIRSMLGEN